MTDYDDWAKKLKNPLIDDAAAALDGESIADQVQAETEALYEPPPLPTRGDAARDRDVALQRVDDAADVDWKELALEAVRITAVRLPEFISDDVWATGLPRTREDRALGPVFLRASRLGYCQKTDRVRPSVRSHLSGKPVWRSLIATAGA